MHAGTLVLASGSPRRIELIGRVVPHFVSLTSGAEEAGSSLKPDFELPPLVLAPPFPVPPAHDPRLWAWRKAAEVASRHAQEIAPDSIILGADTIVVGPGEILNKPQDQDDARRMLSLLRAIPHYVVTGFVLARCRQPGEEILTLHHEAVASTVCMRDFSQDELEAYVRTDEPYDKAGAYALQGLGGSLVQAAEGCLNNIVGLPVCAVRRALVLHGADVRPYPFGGYCEHCPLTQ